MFSPVVVTPPLSVFSVLKQIFPLQPVEAFASDSDFICTSLTKMVFTFHLYLGNIFFPITIVEPYFFINLYIFYYKILDIRN